MIRLTRNNAALSLKSQPRASFAKAMCAAALSAMLAACAVHSPPSITSTSGQLPQGQSVQLAPFEQDGSLRAAFGQALADAISAQSIALADGAPLIADFGIASHDASAGLADPAATTADTVAWESRPRSRGIFDGCAAQRLRATLVLLDRATGAIVYRGVGESNICAAGDEDSADLAAILVSDARGALSAD